MRRRATPPGSPCACANECGANGGAHIPLPQLHLDKVYKTAKRYTLKAVEGNATGSIWLYKSTSVLKSCNFKYPGKTRKRKSHRDARRFKRQSISFQLHSFLSMRRSPCEPLPVSRFRHSVHFPGFAHAAAPVENRRPLRLLHVASRQRETYLLAAINARNGGYGG